MTPTPDRTTYGWDLHWQELAAGVDSAHPIGRVIRVDRGWCSALGDGPEPLRARTTEPVAVGDWVVIDPEREEVVKILERRSILARATGEGRPDSQLLAANVDYVFILQSLTSEVQIRRLERELVVAHESGATPVLVLTKSDVVTPEVIDIAVAQARRVTLDTPIVVVSNHTGAGLDELARFMGAGDTIVMFGRSGVGKSSLVNRLSGREVMATGVVREADDRGKHTTTNSQLIRLETGGLLIDTPGIRALGLTEATGGLTAAFADIEELAATCKFRNCAHDVEPGCAVQAAVRAGALDPARLESWHQLVEETAKAETARVERGWASARKGRR